MLTRCVEVSVPSAVDMSMHVDVAATGAAKRRRERRQWLRHEWMTVAVTPAEVNQPPRSTGTEESQIQGRHEEQLVVCEA